MEELIVEKQTESALYVRLPNPQLLDGTAFARMENDDLALACMVLDEKAGRLMYATSHLISLQAFLAGYTFEREEAYLFLQLLFEKAIAAGRTKPLWLDTRTIYVSAYGDEIYFAALPLPLDYWMTQGEQSRHLVEQIIEQLQVKQAYEICGFLMKALKTRPFSLPALTCGLQDLRALYLRHRFWQKPLRSFRLKEPLHLQAYQLDSRLFHHPDVPASRPGAFTETFSYAQEYGTAGSRPDSQTDQNHQKRLAAGMETVMTPSSRTFADQKPGHPALSPSMSEPIFHSENPALFGLDQPVEAASPGPEAFLVPAPFSSFSDASLLAESQSETTEEKLQPADWMLTQIHSPAGQGATQVMDQEKEERGWLEIQGQSYPLTFENTTIGRHLSNDICVQDAKVSSYHARIVRRKGAYYLQDLKSTNHTWIHDQPVTEPVQLQDGMEIHFGQVTARFIASR